MLAERFQKLLISGSMFDIVILKAGLVYGGILRSSEALCLCHEKWGVRKAPPDIPNYAANSN
jgi:hypothetical protein